MDPGLEQTGQNQAQDQAFHHFLNFGSLVFQEIEQDNGLELCQTTSRGKNYEKHYGGPSVGHAGQNWAQNQIFCHFLKFGTLAFL